MNTTMYPPTCHTCCVFQPEKGGSARCSLVQINCFCVLTSFLFGAFLSFFFLFLQSVTEKYKKTCFNTETNDFDHRPAKGGWSTRSLVKIHKTYPSQPQLQPNYSVQVLNMVCCVFRPVCWSKNYKNGLNHFFMCAIFSGLPSF